MSVVAANRTVGQWIKRTGGTRAADPDALMSVDPKREENRDGWNGLIGDRLVAWSLSTESLDDGDSIPPTAVAIECAVRHARAWRDMSKPCPLDVIPDGDGGILFQINKTPQHEFAIQMLSDGSIDMLHFRGSDLVVHKHFAAS